MSNNISPLADIHPSVKLADKVQVGPFAVIGADVEIGVGTEVKAHAVIHGPTKIGQHNTIFQFASIGDNPQDLKFDDEITYLKIGDHNIFREYCSVNRGTRNGGSITRIGSHNLFMTYTHVAHDCQVGNHNIISSNAALAGHVEINNHVVLGGFTLVGQFLHIGSFAFTGMGTNITKNIPPFAWIAGKPAKALTINKVGMSRNGFDANDIQQAKKMHKLFFKSGLGTVESLIEIETLIQSTPKLHIFVDFVNQHKAHKSGIIKK